MYTTERCVIYVRSAPPAAAEAIGAQIGACRSVAAAHGLTVDDGDVYVDTGFSRLDPAPSAFARLLDAARAGEITTLVTPDWTHLSRYDPRVRDYLEVLLDIARGKVPEEGVPEDRVLFATQTEQLSTVESILKAMGVSVPRMRQST